MKELELSIHLGRISCSHGDDYFYLRIKDVNAGLRVAEIKLSIEQFANLLSNCPSSGKGRLFLSENTGKKLETQTVILPVEKYGDLVTLKKESKKWEKKNPSWTIDKHDLESWNHHRNSNKTYRTSACRWV